MLIRNRNNARDDAGTKLSEVDLGVRQCLQLLWGCTAQGRLDRDRFEAHWKRLADRAMRDFLDDLEVLEGEQNPSDNREGIE